MRAVRNCWTVVAVVIAMLMMAAAHDLPKTEIKHVPIKPTSAASGQEMYKAYCAVCHGADGKGNGPAAEALTVPPTDLTTMATRYGGKYPSLRVAAIIHGEEILAAHGTKEMPIWGSLFWRLDGGHDGDVQQRVSNLNQYVASLQKK